MHRALTRVAATRARRAAPPLRLRPSGLALTPVQRYRGLPPVLQQAMRPAARSGNRVLVDGEGGAQPWLSPPPPQPPQPQPQPQTPSEQLQTPNAPPSFRLPFDSAADSSGAQGSGAQTEAAEAASGSALSSVLRLIARMLLGAGVALASFTATFDWEGLATRLTSDGEAKDSFAASLLAFARPAVRALYGLDPELAVSMHPVAAILLLCATSSDIGSALGKSGLLEVLSEDVERGGERALRSLETLVALCTVDAGRAKISEDAKLLGLLARLVAAGHDAVREQHAESEKKKKKKGYSTLTTPRQRLRSALEEIQKQAGGGLSSTPTPSTGSSRNGMWGLIGVGGGSSDSKGRDLPDLWAVISRGPMSSIKFSMSPSDLALVNASAALAVFRELGATRDPTLRARVAGVMMDSLGAMSELLSERNQAHEVATLVSEAASAHASDRQFMTALVSSPLMGRVRERAQQGDPAAMLLEEKALAFRERKRLPRTLAEVLPGTAVIAAAMTGIGFSLLRNLVLRGSAPLVDVIRIPLLCSGLQAAYVLTEPPSIPNRDFGRHVARYLAASATISASPHAYLCFLLHMGATEPELEEVVRFALDKVDDAAKIRPYK